MEMKQAVTVEASKQFLVPAEKLYQAWNNPEQLKQWWKPMGNQLKEVTNDLTVDGTVRYTFADSTLIISGKYEEVKENEKLVYTWNWEFPDNAVRNALYKLTVLFQSKDNGSEIHIKQENNQTDETLHPNEEGWDKGLSDLEEFLNEKPGSEAGQQEIKSAAFETAGNQEMPEQQKVGGG